MKLMLGGQSRQFVPWHSGYKTYIVMTLGVIVGILQGLNAEHLVSIPIPSWVNWILMFLGGTALRNAITVRSQYITQTMCDLLKLMAAAATVATSAPQSQGSPPMTEEDRTADLNNQQAAKARAARFGTGPQQGVVGSFNRR